VTSSRHPWCTQGMPYTVLDAEGVPGSTHGLGRGEGGGGSRSREQGADVRPLFFDHRCTTGGGWKGISTSLGSRPMAAAKYDLATAPSICCGLLQEDTLGMRSGYVFSTMLIAPGAARGVHWKGAPRLEAPQSSGCLLHDGQVRCEVSLEHVVETQLLQGGYLRHASTAHRPPRPEHRLLLPGSPCH